VFPLLNDVRYGIRQLRRAPVFTIVSINALAVTHHDKWRRRPEEGAHSFGSHRFKGIDVPRAERRYRRREDGRRGERDRYGSKDTRIAR